MHRGGTKCDASSSSTSGCTCKEGDVLIGEALQHILDGEGFAIAWASSEKMQSMCTSKHLINKATLVNIQLNGRQLSEGKPGRVGDSALRERRVGRLSSRVGGSQDVLHGFILLQQQGLQAFTLLTVLKMALGVRL